MTLILPEGVEETPQSSPLEMTDAVKAALVAKAKELLVGPMEMKDLMDALEQYCVFTEGKHYTSSQLKEVINQVEADLAPVVEEPTEPTE